MNLILNNTAWRNAPKNAGTTVRFWISEFEGNLRPFSHDTYYDLSEFGYPKLYKPQNIDQAFEPTANTKYRQWCIVRDPVERFLSAYTDKVLGERISQHTIDELIYLLEQQFNRISSDNLLADSLLMHLLPQTFWFGSDRNYYDYVFSINDMGACKKFCEEFVFKIPLRDIHARNSAASEVDKPHLSQGQISKIERLYSADYENGWHE